MYVHIRQKPFHYGEVMISADEKECEPAVYTILLPSAFDNRVNFCSRLPHITRQCCTKVAQRGQRTTESIISSCWWMDSPFVDKIFSKGLFGCSSPPLGFTCPFRERKRKTKRK